VPAFLWAKAGGDVLGHELANVELWGSVDAEWFENAVASNDPPDIHAAWAK
jgi:hypothetical protein